MTCDMHQAIERIERIVQGLVDYARPGADRGSDDRHHGATDLNRAVADGARLPGCAGMLRGQTLEVSLEPDLPPVCGDRTCWSRWL